MKWLKRVLAVATISLACIAHARPLGGIAELQVFDRTAGRPLPVVWHEGRAYVAGTPGNEYQVVLRNREAGDLLAVVTVDGVNVITGQSASPEQSGYVIEPGRPLEIRGWRKSLTHTAAFYFSALSDSYAARTGRPDDVGVIGVALFRRKVERAAELARPEPSAKAEGSADTAGARGAQPESPLGTGHGRREASPARYASFERATSAPAELITLYYDSRPNLVARGVLREPVRLAPLPRPFPGFVPDPRG